VPPYCRSALVEAAAAGAYPPHRLRPSAGFTTGILQWSQQSSAASTRLIKQRVSCSVTSTDVVADLVVTLMLDRSFDLWTLARCPGPVRKRTTLPVASKTSNTPRPRRRLRWFCCPCSAHEQRLAAPGRPLPGLLNSVRRPARPDLDPGPGQAVADPGPPAGWLCRAGRIQSGWQAAQAHWGGRRAPARPL